MGYIAPITNFQIVQYAERDTIQKYDPYIFVPITRTQYVKNERIEEQTIPFINIKMKKNRGTKQETIDQMYAKLTGKGRLFNERV